MRIRTILLAGAVFPFSIGGAGFALAQTPLSPASWMLAQTDTVVCADGTPATATGECPPIQQAPAETAPPGEPPAEPPAAEQAPTEAAPAEQAPVETAPAEQAPAETPVEPAAPAEQPAPAQKPAPDAGAAPADEAPAPTPEAPVPEAAPAAPAEEAAPATTTQEQPAVAEPTAEPVPPAAVQQEPLPVPEAAPADAAPAAEAAPEPPAAGEAPTPEDVLRRAQQQQQQLQEQQGQQAEQPANQPPANEQPATTAEPLQPAAPGVQDPAAAAAPIPEAPSVVEQQLEAQGDDQQAEQIRILREKLRQESEAAAAAAPPAADAGQQPQATEEDGGSGWGWWRRDGERADRRDRGDRGRGRGEIVEERGDRIIIDLGGGNIYVEPVVPDEGERLLYGASDVEVQDLPGGRTQTIVYRENGSQIITIRDRRGEIIRRVRVTPNGREVVLIDNRYEDDYEELPPGIIFEVDDLPPLVIDIPEEDYIVDLGRASEADIEGALLAPPVQRVERSYTLEEVTRNERVRAYVPRIDLDTITFEFGSATIGNNQMRALTALGRAMEKVLAERPDEVYLIEGHTDAVGSPYDNLILSDRRAEAVAVALSQNFNIPPENLVTEGYGEQYLKVQTEEPSRENRRATVRRITELLQAENQQQ